MAELGASGYTLPVWVAAAARAALQQLLGEPFCNEQPLLLERGAQQPELLPVQAVAPLGRVAIWRWLCVKGVRPWISPGA